MDLLCTRLCTCLLLQGSPEPKSSPYSGGSHVQEHTNTGSHISECPTGATPAVLQKNSPLLLWSVVMQDAHLHCTGFGAERVFITLFTYRNNMIY